MASEHRLTDPEKRVDQRLQAALERAVGAGILTDEQARAVLDHELAGGPAADTHQPAVQRRVPLAIEVLGYLGAVLVLAGAGILAAEFWDELDTVERLLALGVAAGALTVAGLAVRDESEPVLRRLRGVVLLLGSAALIGFAALFGVRALDLDGGPAAVLVGAVGIVHAAALWQLRERPAQHLACLASVVVAVTGAAVWMGGEAGGIGAALWVTGALWLAASVAGLLPPVATGQLLGSVLVLVAPGVVAIQHEGPGSVLALATATALVVLGAATGRAVPIAAGVVGLLVYLPLAVNWFLDDAIGVPAALLLVGLALLGVVLPVVVRRARTAS